MKLSKSAIISKYPAFIRFKKDVGHSNQMLITACIGINKVSEEDVGKINPAPWNPVKWETSVDRSRLFVISASLIWVIDCLDVLLKNFFPYFFDERNRFTINGEERSYVEVHRSIYNKYAVIKELFLEKEEDILAWRKQTDYRSGKKGSEPYFPDLQLVFALLELGIQWRNHLVHSDIDNVLAQDAQRIISRYKVKLKSNIYGALEEDEMLKRFKKKKQPSFKEVTVLIRNVIDFGFIINAYWINCVNKKQYVNRCLSEILPLDFDEVIEYQEKGKDKDDKIIFFNSIQSLTSERMKSSICMRLCDKGMGTQEREGERISEEDKAINEYLLELKLLDSGEQEIDI